ncbi:MAG: hypothetical protein JOZ46_04940 [Candidatus Dormibacteraeota bacterium]|nr:hypothetical protein [Candidatus Dormibacteraeota bacterium]
MIATDGQGHFSDSNPQGFPGGQGAYYFSSDHGATWSSSVLLGGATGGGDEDNVYAPYDGSKYAGEMYIADLAATHSTVCYSMDHGATFWAVGTGPNSPANTPDPNACKAETLGATTPSSDRQWLTADKGGRAYITDHEFFSAQPRMWTTTDGGGDAFVTPCGSIIGTNDPLLEQYVPQDITGGTLVSKPVVDSNGTVYVLFTTTTQQENGGAAQNSTLSGTFSEVFLAVSTDHCTTFNDYTVFDGFNSNLPCNGLNPPATCNTDQFGDIFNQLAIDPQGDLYAAAAGFVGTTPFATTTDVYLFTHKAADPLGTWTGPTKLTNDGQGHMLPAITAGLLPGQAAVGFFRTVNNITDPNNTSAMWTYTILESSNALDASPTFSFTDMTGGSGTSHNLYHLGDICNSGTLCGTGAPGTGTDRSLGDFSSATLDSTGCPFFSFAGNPGGDSNGTLAYVTHQTSNCFAGLASNVPEAPFVSTLVLAGGVAAAASVGVRRLRRRTSAK